MKKIRKQTITNKTRILTSLLLLSLTLLFCLTTVSAAPGDTIYVNTGGNDSWDGQSAAYSDTTGSGPKLSIKNATGVVNTNGTIHIANGQYKDENNTNITIDKNMNIIGESQTGTIINGTGTNWIFQINPGVNVTLTNLTLTNAIAGNGSAIYNNGTLTVTNCTFTNNQATAPNTLCGGTIYNKGTISVSGCNFTNNTATNGGGAIYNYGGTITNLSDCNFTNNTADGGGAIINRGTINSLSGCNFTNNKAIYDQGGAIYNYGGTISSLTDCTFTNNTATNFNSGGAIWNHMGTISSLTDCTFTNNKATYHGGAILNDGGTITNLSDCNFTNNTATSCGGAILNDGGTITNLSDCNFTNNTATVGGALYNYGTITDLSGCNFINNKASMGGAISNYGGSLTANYNRFYNNTITNANVNAIYCYSGSVNATLNWWGSNSPQNILNLIVERVGGSVNASTWVILTINANPTTIYNTQTSVITADFNHYTDNTGYIGELSNHIPDGIQVIFSLTNGPLGSFNGLTSPVTLFTSEGLASILFNATSTSIQNIEASTDNEKVSTSITINDIASTGDFVWNDINKNGIQDAGEAGIPGVTVNLYNSTGEIIATTTTNAAGHYLFNNIIPGTYSLGFVLPIGYKFSSQNQGTDDTKDSDVDVTTGKTITTTLLSGENDLTWDAGMYMIPVAVDDTATTYEDISLTSGNVAGNDVPSGDGGNVWSVVSGPDHGTLVMNADGTYTYTPNKDYNGHDQFTYQIKDVDGDTSTAKVDITINSVNDLPVAVDDTATTNEDTRLTGNVADNDIWSGDGGNVWSVVSGPAHTGTGYFIIHDDGNYVYIPDPDYNGPDQFTYKVTDANGDFSTATMTITVNPVNDAPTVGNYDVTTPEDTSTSGQVVGNDVDSTLTYSVTKNPSHGTLTSFNPNTGAWTYMPGKDYNGDDSFEVTVSDGIATAISKITIHVTAVNDDPVTNGDSQTIDEDTTATGKVTATDADGDSLTYAKGSDPADGTVTVNSATGTYIYTPNPNWHGTDSFTVTVNDINGGFATATVTITVNPVNDAPVAVNDGASTDEDNSVDIDVLTNDTDMDTGDSLSINSFTQPGNGTTSLVDGKIRYTPNPNWHGTDTFTYTTRDNSGAISNIATVTITVNPVNDAPIVDNYSSTTPEDTPTGGTVVGSDVDSTLTYSLGTQASNGTAVVNPDGTWTYTPKPNYNGPDSFTVTVSDGTLTATSTITITINPVNDAPMAVNDGASTDEDNSVDIDVLANDTDVDAGDSLTVTIGTDADAPKHGTANVKPDGTVTYTPKPDYNGSDSFKYIITDTGGLTSTATVTITINPVNDAPIAQNDSKTIDEDSSATGKVTASDVDEDTLTYSVGTGSEGPQHGTVNLNSTTGAYTYTPNPNWHGTDSFKVLVSDGNGGTAVSTVTITVNSVNDIPVAQNDTATTKEGKSININVLNNDSDADGDSLTVTNVTHPNHGTATINADGTITYTPNNNWYGTDSFTYTVSDGNGGTTTATVTITVNQAVSNLYIKTTTSSQTPTVGETFTLTYKLGNNGPDAAENVTITFQIPEGLDFINIRVDNGKYTYNETTRTITWTLDSVPVGDPYLYLTVKAADDGTYKITPNITSDTYNLNSGDDGIITFNVQPNSNANTVNAASKTTIGLQKTGLPLNYLILAILMVLSGLIPKRK